MKNIKGDESIHPIQDNVAVYNDRGTNRAAVGLTIRQHFAAMAMQGLLTQENPQNSDFSNLADCAVIYADALIKALNK